MSALLVGITAVLLSGAPAQATGGYRFIGTPVASIVSNSTGTALVIAVRTNKAASASSGVQLGVSAVGFHTVYGAGSNAHRIGLSSKHCYYSEGVGTGDEGLPASLQHPKVGQKVTVVFTSSAGRVSKTVRLQKPSARQVVNEAWYSRALGCAH